MKQEINLFIGKEKSNLWWDVDFVKMIRFIILFIGILFLTSVYEGIKNFSIMREVNNVELEKKTIEMKLIENQKQIPLKQDMEQLKAEIEIQTLTQKIKKEMINKLVDSEDKQLSGFSEYLGSLSRKTISGLWLTRINCNKQDTHYALEGKTLEPNAIPKFMEGLSLEPVFAGKTFQVFKVSIDEVKRHSFLLETRSKSMSST